MLSRLSIRDIVLIERLDIDYAAGLSVLTGETGAGKSILIDAVAGLLGGRLGPDVVRQGADAARIEGIFQLEAERSGLGRELAELGVEPEDGVIIRDEDPNPSHQGLQGPAPVRRSWCPRPGLILS